MLSEKERIDQIALHFSMADGFNGYMTKYRVDTVLRNCQRGTLLDIGSADAYMAEALSSFYERIVSLDGSEKLIDNAKKRLKGVTHIEFVCSLVEEFDTKEQFDVVLLSFILEHVDNPVDLLVKSKRFVKNNGCIFIMVPNADSLHRRVGKNMGLIQNLDSLNQTDIQQGHRRVYTPDLLAEHASEAGLMIIDKGTFFIKPFSNSQMEKVDKKIADALYEVSHELQGLGSMIYLKASV